MWAGFNNMRFCSRGSSHGLAYRQALPTGRQAGFTLIETLVTAAIVVILSWVLIGMYLNYTAFHARQGASLEMVLTAGQLANRLHMNAAQASTIADTHTFAGTAYTSSADTLVLQLPAVNASGDILPATYDYVAYYATGTIAYELIDANAGSIRLSGSKTLSTTVESLSFTYQASPSSSGWVEMDLQTETASSSAATTTTHITERSYLRN